LFEAAVRERTGQVMGGLAGTESLDPKQSQKALETISERFLMLTRDEEVLGKFRSVYGAAGARPEACRAFYRQGPERLTNELAVYLRRAHAAGTLKVPQPQLAADLFLSMFMGDGHIRRLLMPGMSDAREDKALLREAVRVFMTAYSKPS
jgi:TetR/AcrR family transcriptional repressor of mexJK operon